MQKKNHYARFAPAILICSALVMPLLVWSAMGAMRGANNDVRQWLPSGFVETQQYDWFLTQFGSEEMAVVSWPGATIDDKRLDEVTAGLQPYVGEEAADSTSASPKFFKRVTSSREAIAELTAPPMSLSHDAAVRRLHGLLVGPDGKTAGLVVMVNDYGAKHRKAAVEAVHAVAQTAGIASEELHIGGPTIDSVALDSESQRSRYLLTALSVSLALVLAWRCLMDVTLVAMVFATAIMAALTSIAIAFALGDRMNLLLVMMPTLVYLTAMSGAIHLVNYYRDALAEGISPTEAPLHAVKAAFMPGFLCAATTAVGLGSLATSQVVPVRQFGTYSALGVMAAMPILYLVLPCLLQLFPSRVKKVAHVEPQAVNPMARDWATLTAAWLSKRHAWVLAAATIVMVATGLGLSRLNTSVKLLNLFSPDSTIIRDYTWLERNMGPLVPIEVVLNFKPDNELSMLDRLKLVKRVEQELAQIEKVGGTMSAATFSPDLPTARGIRAVTQRSLLNKHLKNNRDYLEGKHYLRTSENGELWRISARVEALNAIDYGYFIEQIKGRVEPLLTTSEATQVADVEATYTGIVPLIYKAQRTMLNDLMVSFLTAFLIIAGMMMLILRKFTAGLISMIPNVFPAVIIFGTMGLSGMLCDIGSMMTAGVALGIAVDDTIHYLAWFRRGLAQGLSRHESIVMAYQRCAGAMIQSSIICGLGLLVFSFSKFVPTSRFAYLMATMLGAALVGDLFILPALLSSPLGRFFEDRKSPKRTSIVPLWHRAKLPGVRARKTAVESV